MIFESWLFYIQICKYCSFTSLKLHINITPRVLGITRSDDLNEIRNNFHYIDNLVSIRRSTASVLDRGDGAGGKISLQSIMPTHEVKTVEVDYAEDEKPEMQWTHRASAQ